MISKFHINFGKCLRTTTKIDAKLFSYLPIILQIETKENINLVQIRYHGYRHKRRNMDTVIFFEDLRSIFRFHTVLAEVKASCEGT